MTSHPTALPSLDDDLPAARRVPTLLTPAQAYARVSGGAVLVDTRSAGNRDTNGAIPGALVAERTEVAAQFGPTSPDRFPQVTSLETPIVVVCGSTAGSGPVAAALLDLGYSDVSHVADGFAGWREGGFPAAPPVVVPQGGPGS